MKPASPSEPAPPAESKARMPAAAPTAAGAAVPPASLPGGPTAGAGDGGKPKTKKQLKRARQNARKRALKDKAAAAQQAAWVAPNAGMQAAGAGSARSEPATRLPPRPEQQQAAHRRHATPSTAADAIGHGSSPAASSAVVVFVAVASPTPVDAAVAMLGRMFGVQADAAHVALRRCDGDVAAAGQLLAQQVRDEDSAAAQAALASATRGAVAEARREEREAAREAAQDAMECKLCMDAPKTHSFMPCNHRCACARCAERVMRLDRRCQ